MKNKKDNGPARRQKPGWSRSNGAFWARPQHVTKVDGPNQSQDRVVLDHKLVDHIRRTDPTKNSGSGS